ncbi:MAG: CRTAC1 family protein [Verrucomicrobia bacterium]|nr:CRTAC1 family protein [Verrucomicrobiota bacterium]
MIGIVGCNQKASPPQAAAPAAKAAPWFEDITAKSGLQFVHEVELSGNYLMPEQTGTGAAVLDYDNDGRLDIYLVHNVAPTARAANGLFHQEPDGRFKDVSAGSGLDVAGYGMGVTVGDVNNDGWPDVLVAENARVRLFLNLGGAGKFKDITAEAGITNAAWAVPAAFLDYDRDGWLDLIVGNYLEFDPSKRCYSGDKLDFCGPAPHGATVSKLFHNVTSRAEGQGRVPRFQDVTVASGLARWPGKAMGIVCADFDGDRWPDIFITDDALPNRLFMNQRNGTFLEQAVPRGLAYNALGSTASNMGIAVGDVDGDGMFDVFVPHLAEESHALWSQGPAGVFQDKTAAAGLMASGWHGTGFAPLLADFNGDGALDLSIANGAVNLAKGLQTPAAPAQTVSAFWAPYAHPNQLFANDGQGRFREISPANPAFCGEATVGRGLICGDIDNDGAPDLLVSSIGSPALLFRNVAVPRGHWLGLRLIEPALGNRDAYGAEVFVQVGARRLWRLAQPGYSYCSSNDPRVHFGLGAAAKVDAIRVVWPDGTEEAFPGCAADQYLALRKGTGQSGKP